MNIVFSELDDDFLKKQVEGGAYSNVTEVVRDAVRRMREQAEQRRLEELRLLLATGLEQAERGEVRAYQRSRLDELLSKAIDNSQAGRPVKTAVKSA